MDKWDDDLTWVAAALRTSKASRWRVWIARLFGTRVESRDGTSLIVGYQWRGRLYLTDYKH